MSIKKINIVLDVEASGQVPGMFDMISLGMIVLEPALDRTFYGEMRPLHDAYQQGAYNAVGITRAEHEAMPPVEETMLDLFAWIKSLDADRVTIWSDNNGFDFAWLNWYTWWSISSEVAGVNDPEFQRAACATLGTDPSAPKSPFGHSSRRIGDFAAGCSQKAMNQNFWKAFRKTTHSHRADDDARGNAEALLTLFEKYDIKPIWPTD